MRGEIDKAVLGQFNQGNLEGRTMSITVLKHQHDQPISIEGVGSKDALLIIQTGIITFNHQGVAGEDWVRDQLRLAVIDLPPGALAITNEVRAVASATPASISYSPGSTSVIDRGSSVAQGNITVNGSTNQWGGVRSEGSVSLPVVRTGPPAEVLVAGAGWAIDGARAEKVQSRIELIVDLAVVGPSILQSLAYSIFVTASTRESILRPDIIR
jgi:hypothetical protein